MNNIIWLEFTARGTSVFWDLLKSVVRKYNNTAESTIGMKPALVKKKQERMLLEKLQQPKDPKTSIVI